MTINHLILSYLITRKGCCDSLVNKQHPWADGRGNHGRVTESNPGYPGSFPRQTHGKQTISTTLPTSLVGMEIILTSYLVLLLRSQRGWREKIAPRSSSHHNGFCGKPLWHLQTTNTCQHNVILYTWKLSHDTLRFLQMEFGCNLKTTYLDPVCFPLMPR